MATWRVQPASVLRGWFVHPREEGKVPVVGMRYPMTLLDRRKVKKPA